MKEPRDFIQQYYESIRDKYPELSYVQIEEVCRHPFTFVKEKMKQPNLPEVRLKYFGVFRVKMLRVNDRFAENEKMFSLGRITEERYLHFKNILTNFIERNESKSNNDQCD